MRTSPTETAPPRTEAIRTTSDSLVVDLVDGRTIEIPLSWYPRLHHGTTRERAKWRLIGGGTGIHWPDLDEDISSDGLRAGLPSGESQSSFETWLESRPKAEPDKRKQPTARKPRRG